MRAVVDFFRYGGPFAVHLRDEFATLLDSYQGDSKPISSICLLLTQINKTFRAGIVFIAVR